MIFRTYICVYCTRANLAQFVTIVHLVRFLPEVAPIIFELKQKEKCAFANFLNRSIEKFCKWLFLEPLNCLSIVYRFSECDSQLVIISSQWKVCKVWKKSCRNIEIFVGKSYVKIFVLLRKQNQIFSPIDPGKENKNYTHDPKEIRL